MSVIYHLKAYVVNFQNSHIILIWLPWQRFQPSHWLNTGTDVTQKRNIDLTRFLVQMASRCVSTKLCHRIFNLFFNLNYVVKLPDWPVPGYHGNRIKIRRHSFVRIVITHLPPKYGYIRCFVFELHLFPCLTNQKASSVAIATDQNNVWILKVHDISFQVIYDTHGCG